MGKAIYLNRKEMIAEGGLELQNGKKNIRMDKTKGEYNRLYFS